MDGGDLRDACVGIGLSTAIFSVVYSVLLQPLPYPDAGRLMALWPSVPSATYSRFNVNAALWVHWRGEGSELFTDIALTRPVANFNLTGYGAPERLQGARTTANLPEVLGVEPLMGRVFTKRNSAPTRRWQFLATAFGSGGSAAIRPCLGARFH